MNQLNLLFVGRVELKKGADVLLKAAAELKNKINFRIDVVGEGDLKAMLDRKDLNIYTHGFLKEERYEFFEQADLLLAPSRWPEPFGMVALEAMEYRLPIITFDCSGGLRDLVEQNKTGIVSTEKTLARDILNLYNNKKQIELFKSNCRNVRNYSKEKIFNQYKKLLEKIAYG